MAAATTQRLSPEEVATELEVSVRTVSHYATRGLVLGRGPNKVTVKLVRKRDGLGREYLDRECLERFRAEVAKVIARLDRKGRGP